MGAPEVVALEFAEPTVEILIQIESLLRELEMVTLRDVRRLASSTGEIYEEGVTTSALIASLREYLQADYAAGVAEAKKVNWTFDYIVIKGGFHKDLLSVLTRLKSLNPSQGQIFYGSRFFRTGANSFACSIEGNGLRRSTTNG